MVLYHLVYMCLIYLPRLVKMLADWGLLHQEAWKIFRVQGPVLEGSFVPVESGLALERALVLLVPGAVTEV